MQDKRRITIYRWTVIFALLTIANASFGLFNWQQEVMALTISFATFISLTFIGLASLLLYRLEQQVEESERRYQKWSDHEFIVREVSKKNPKLVMEVLEKAAIDLDKHFRNQQTLLSLRERNEEQEAKLEKVTESVNYEKDNFWRLVDAARSAGLDLKSMNSYRSFIRDAQF